MPPMQRSSQKRTPAARSVSRTWILAIPLCALALAGCASSSTRARHSSQHSTPLLRIGQGASLRGPRKGEELRVTLLFYEPSLPGTTNDHPEFDYQFAAAHERLQNLGSLPYSGSPARDISIGSTEAQTSKRAHLSEGSCADAFAQEVKLAPGASAEGCVPAQTLVVSTSASLRYAPSPAARPPRAGR